PHEIFSRSLVDRAGQRHPLRLGLRHRRDAVRIARVRGDAVQVPRTAGRREVTHSSRRFFWICFAGWLLLVLIVSSRHEFYRDEVRALSLAMDAGSLSDLPHLLKDEGHPILWYVLLWSGYHITSSTRVLPVLSVLIAGAAVVVFV